MKRIRLATPEEIESIKAEADIDIGCVVYALDTAKGTGLAVRRVCNEIDPMISPEGWEPRHRLLFSRDIETVLAAQGITHYYFNVDANEENWINSLKAWGAESQSKSPEIRMKKVL